MSSIEGIRGFQIESNRAVRGKNAWNTIMEKYALLQLPEIVDCIEVFKEPIDFKVLDKVPVPRGLLQIVQGKAEEYTKYILTAEDRAAVDWVRKLEREIQSQLQACNDLHKRVYSNHALYVSI